MSDLLNIGNMHDFFYFVFDLFKGVIPPTGRTILFHPVSLPYLKEQRNEGNTVYCTTYRAPAFLRAMPFGEALWFDGCLAPGDMGTGWRGRQRSGFFVGLAGFHAR